MLEDIGTFYEEEAERRIKRLVVGLGAGDHCGHGSDGGGDCDVRDASAARRIHDPVMPVLPLATGREPGSCVGWPLLSPVRLKSEQP